MTSYLGSINKLHNTENFLWSLLGLTYTKTGKVLTTASATALFYQFTSWLIFSLGKSSYR